MQRTRSLLIVALVAAVSTGCGAARGSAVATHAEGDPIAAALPSDVGRLATFGVALDGSLLLCAPRKMAILVLGADGKLKATWDVGLAPQAVYQHTDGTTYVGGGDKLARLDRTGKVLRASANPAASDGYGAVAAIAATDKDVFMALRGKTYAYSVWRLDHELGNAKEIATGLRGCCGQMHLVAKDDVVYVAENARHQVVRYDREGKALGAWGKRDRVAIDGFTSCCNPMNLALGPKGELYTSETTTGGVKRFTPDGKFLGFVGRADVGGGCVNVAIGVSKDGSRVYVFDSAKNLIRVLKEK